MQKIQAHLKTTSLFVAIGTSGDVYSATAFVREACSVATHTVELNLVPSSVVSDFAETYIRPAPIIVPNWVARQLAC